MFEAEKELVSELLNLCNESEKEECSHYAMALIAAEAAAAMKGNKAVSDLVNALTVEANDIQTRVMDDCNLEASTEVGIKVLIGKRRVIMQVIEAINGPDMTNFAEKVKRAIKIIKENRESEKN
jgi:hypothetical protein